MYIPVIESMPSLTMLLLLLLSDRTVRVWNYSSESEDNAQQVLRGHTSHVRGLCWSPELGYLLYTGSWDYTIIMWDVRNGDRLSIISDHGGDVYGQYL